MVYLKTIHIGNAVTERQREGLDVPPELLAHISPL
ncbi:Tn501 transposase, partial [Pseudomonas savastanoi pv. glycinea str. race 4]